MVLGAEYINPATNRGLYPSTYVLGRPKQPHTAANSEAPGELLEMPNDHAPDRARVHAGSSRRIMAEQKFGRKPDMSREMAIKF